MNNVLFQPSGQEPDGKKQQRSMGPYSLVGLWLCEATEGTDRATLSVASSWLSHPKRNWFQNHQYQWKGESGYGAIEERGDLSSELSPV